MNAEQRVVLRALGTARGHRLDAFKWPESVAAATPNHMPPAASGKAQPMGERRVRALLNELVLMGYAERTRSHFGGHAWRITDEGKAAR